MSFDPKEPENFESSIEDKYGFARLEDGKVIPCKLDDWACWYSERKHRIIGRYETEAHLVSTVFLGLNHSHYGNVRPVWFETMIFDKTKRHELELAGKLIGGWTIGEVMYEERYSTLKEAEQGHQAAIAWLNDEIDLYKSRGFICPICGAVSHNPKDLLHRYCGHCHRFVDDPL